MAGLGVTNPSTSAPVAYGVSRKATIHLVNAIITGKEEFDPGRHHESVAKARQEARLSREKELPTKFDTCVSALGGLSERCARRAKDFSTGAWLSAMPSEKNNTVLSAEEFRDGLAMRFNKPGPAAPSQHLRCQWPMANPEKSLRKGSLVPRAGTKVSLQKCED